MAAVALQILCVLLILGAALFVVYQVGSFDTRATPVQTGLVILQIFLCGWFFALCISDVLDLKINFSLVRVVVNSFYFLAFFTVTLYALFFKYKENPIYIRIVVVTYILLMIVQCFIFPYGSDSQSIRIFEYVEGALVIGLLVLILIRLDDGSFCRRALIVCVVLEMIVAVETVWAPYTSIISDPQIKDIPLNYAALFMRPVLFGTLALIYQVWMDRKIHKSYPHD